MVESTINALQRNCISKRNSKYSLSLSQACYMFGVPVVFWVAYLLFCLFDSFYPLLLGFTISFFWTLIISIKKFGLFSLYCIFLYTSAFFIYSIVFVETLLPHDKFDFLTINWPITYIFESEVGEKFLIVCFLQTYVMHIVYCIRFKDRIYKTQKDKCENVLLTKAGIVLLVIFMIPALLKSFIQLRYVFQNGYSSIFLGGVSEIDYPFWMRGAFSGIMAGYCVFLSGNPSKRKFKVITILYIFLNLISSLKGQRAMIICTIIVCAYWYQKKYNVKISFKKYVLIGVLILVLIVGLDSVRKAYGGKKANDSTDYSIENVTDLLVEQSRSRIVPMLVIEGDLKYRNYPFVFQPLLSPYYSIKYGSGQTDEIVMETNDISGVTMYHVARSGYLSGMGFGGAFLAEAYDFAGCFGVILFSYLLAVCLAKFDNSNLSISTLLIPLAFQFLLTIPMLPRNRVFGFVSNYIPILLSYFVIILIKFIYDMCKYNN